MRINWFTIFIVIFIFIVILYSIKKINIESFEQNSGINVIYYINLDHRPDRNAEFLEEMDKIHFSKDKIVRVSAVYEKDRGHLGCTKSHIKTLELFIQSNHNNCIIFEDDFEFINHDSSVLQQIDNILDNNIPYDVIMLSANEINTSPSNYISLVNVTNAQTASGYMVSKEFAPILLQNFKEGYKLLEQNYDKHNSYAIDQYWKLLQPISQWYMFEPKLGKQRASYSDIQNGIVDYNV